MLNAIELVQPKRLTNGSMSKQKTRELQNFRTCSCVTFDHLAHLSSLDEHVSRVEPEWSPAAAGNTSMRLALSDLVAVVGEGEVSTTCSKKKGGGGE